MTERFDCTDQDQLSAGIEAAREALARRECVVLPTDTVYGIGADAFSPQAVAVLLAAKGRNRTMPPPVLMGSTGVLDGLAMDVPDTARQLAHEFWPGALTLIVQAQPTLTWDLGETRGTVALRVPGDDITRSLLQSTGPMAVSSANRTGMPAATTVDEAESMLGESVAVYLDGGERTTQAPSTIVDCTVSPFLVVREGAITEGQLRAVAPEGFEDTNAAPESTEPTETPADDAGEPTTP